MAGDVTQADSMHKMNKVSITAKKHVNIHVIKGIQRFVMGDDWKRSLMKAPND